MTDVPMKMCNGPICRGTPRPLSEFHRRGTGWQSECKVCMKERLRLRKGHVRRFQNQLPRAERSRVRLSADIPRDLSDALGAAAKVTGETKSALIVRLLRDDMRAGRWRVEDIERIVRASDA